MELHDSRLSCYGLFKCWTLSQFLAARDTLDSIVHETCTKLEFYGISKDKLVFQHEILMKNLVVPDERANDEHDDDDDDDDDDEDDDDCYTYGGKFCKLAANYCSFFHCGKSATYKFFDNFRSLCLDGDR